MIDNKEFKREKDYLKTVLYTLEKEIEKNSNKVNVLNEELEAEMKYAWDATNLLNETEFTYAIADIHRRSFSKNNINDKIKSYKKMIKCAYFARFDFDDGDEVMPVYLGIATLQNGNDFYVYDWRAPICGMFYDYELGEASYQTPNGDTVAGKVTLKRQFKIEGDEIKEVFDTDMQIIDKILQQMLQENTSSKMKHIVNTIQKEQNKVIRKNDVDILVVTGPAGSGKTSVAMHKIAYILYTFKDKIDKNNVLILSPNDIFSSYISNVLPQIGEDNVYQTTFMDYIKSSLTEYKVSGSLSDIYEKIYGDDSGSKEYNSIKLKFGEVYINLIENYLKSISTEILGLKDIVLDNQVIIEKKYLEKLASELESSGLSYLEQYNKLVEKVILHATIKTQKSQNENVKLRKLLQNNKISPKNIYLNLYSNRDRFVNFIEEIYNTTGASKSARLTIKELDEIFNITAANLNKGIMQYEDVCAYLYMKNRLIGAAGQNKIRYVLIDEAQDYSLMQYKILSNLFKDANITILGDLNQCIMPFSAYKSFDSVVNILSENKTKATTDNKYLSKTYRSTVEINEFAKKIVADSPLYNQIDRHGDKVEIVENKDDYKLEQILQAIKLKKTFNSVAIITKNQKEADSYKQIISDAKKTNYVRVLNKKDKSYLSDRVMIVPSYLSKGLEFDAVIVSNASSELYSENERNLFYVVCTRALHKLVINYNDKLTKLIN